MIADLLTDDQDLAQACRVCESGGKACTAHPACSSAGRLTRRQRAPFLPSSSRQPPIPLCLR